jgi:hypothetical protein
MDDNQPAQLTGEQMDEILQAALAPWDARSWANLEEHHPATADALAYAVRFGGLTAEDVRDYCNTWGYLPEVANWLRQCVLHLGRMQAAEVEAQGDETAGALTSPPPSIPPDAEGDAVTTPDDPARRPSLRLVEPGGRGDVRRLVEQGEGE